MFKTQSHCLYGLTRAWAVVVLVLPAAAVAGEVGFQAFEDAFNGISPAVPFMAVGPSHIVAASNNGIRFFTKAGTLTYDNTFSGSNGFFPGGGTPFAPQVTIDPHTNRFIVAGYYTYGFNDFITVALSDSEDPNGNWQIHTINVDSANGVPLFNGDRPTLGVDATTIYVYNDFYFAGDPFDPFSHGFLFSIDKQAFMNGEAPAVVAVEPFDFPAAPVPACTYDDDAEAQYLVTPFGTFATEDKIRLFAVRDALGTPDIDTVEVEVPPYDFVAFEDGMPHPNGSMMTATDTRMRRAVYRDGSLWTAHHVRDPGTGRHQSRWYQVAMNGWPVSGGLPALVQAGAIDLGPTYHSFLPDVSPDAAGNAVIVFHHTSANTPPAVARGVHAANDPPGHVGALQTLRETEVELSPSAVYAAGSACAVDPADPATAWVGGAYWVTNQWQGRQPAMWINSVTLPALPGDLDGNGVVDLDDFVIFSPCMLGPGIATSPECAGADFDGDGDADLSDFAGFETVFGGL